MKAFRLLDAMFVTLVVATVGCARTAHSNPDVRQEPNLPGLEKKDLIKDKAARAVVLSMYRTYSTCITYSDTGVSRGLQGEIRFVTRFKRPKRIYFEYRDGKKPAEVSAYWSKGLPKRIWNFGVDGPGYWDETVLTSCWYAFGKKVEKDRSLGMTVAGFTGISAGTGATVTTMLFPKEVESLSFSDMEDLRWIGTDLDRGVTCDLLESKKHFTKAWIDKKAHILRRMAERFDPNDPEDITEYLPVLNRPISDNQMVFTPRKAPKRGWE